MTNDERERIAALLPKLREFAGTVQDTTAKNSLDTALSTIHLHLKSERPSRAIVREALHITRDIVEEAGGALLAEGILALAL